MNIELTDIASNGTRMEWNDVVKADVETQTFPQTLGLRAFRAWKKARRFKIEEIARALGIRFSDVCGVLEGSLQPKDWPGLMKEIDRGIAQWPKGPNGKRL